MPDDAVFYLSNVPVPETAIVPGQVLTADKASYSVVWKGGKAMAKTFNEAVRTLPEPLRRPLEALPRELRASVTEVRLRADAPLTLTVPGAPLFLLRDGRTARAPSDDMRIVSPHEMEDAFLRACAYSVLSRQPEIRQGYLTLEGGHRLGLGGVCGSDGSFARVTSINLRIARIIPDAADALYRQLFAQGLASPILAGPPLSGKTTMLRALADRLSRGTCGRAYRVSVVDSRREFGALPCCDVLAGFDKPQGVRMALRSLSPEVLLCDEVTTAEEAAALEACFSAGAACVVSVHAAGESSLSARVPLQRLLRTGQFTHVVLLDEAAPGRILRILESRECMA